MVDLSGATILVSNDDGIHAPGLKVLEKAFKELGAQVIVVAPEIEQSGAGHSLTLRRPLRIREVSQNRYAVDGTPTDCVLLAVNKVLGGKKPDLLLSGINRGGNLGEDVTYSGTIAAAMEGTLLGIRSIALSQQYTDPHPVKWSVSEHHVIDVVERLSGFEWPKGALMNVNFPDVTAQSVKGVQVTEQGDRKIGGEIVEGRDPRGEPYYWIGAQRSGQRYDKGTDLEAVRNGWISVTPLSMDLTHRGLADRLNGAFS